MIFPEMGASNNLRGTTKRPAEKARESGWKNSDHPGLITGYYRGPGP
jgi:hypothetical protein